MTDIDLDDGSFSHDMFAAPQSSGGFNPLLAGTAYALFRHGQDKQTAALTAAIRANHAAGPVTSAPIQTPVQNIDPERAEAPPFVNVADHVDIDVTAFKEIIGQEPLKRQLMVHMEAAKARGERMPHTLLASGFPGVGKTTFARAVAAHMGGRIVEMMPPFNAYTLAEAMESLGDGDVLFLDEIHKLADSGKRGAEILLKPLEEGVMFLPDGSVLDLARFTIIGATTDVDKLPEPVLDRFAIRPYFQPYDVIELGRIAITFAWKLNWIDDDEMNIDLAKAMARACRDTPRVLEKFVMAARDMHRASGAAPTAEELLAFVEVEPDGLTRTHIQYLTSLRQFFARMTKDETVEYIVGEAAIQQILRETSQGIGRIERFLIERGLIDRTPRGRRLTERGILRAEEFIAMGKGASSAA